MCSGRLRSLRILLLLYSSGSIKRGTVPLNWAQYVGCFFVLFTPIHKLPIGYNRFVSMSDDYWCVTTISHSVPLTVISLLMWGPDDNIFNSMGIPKHSIQDSGTEGIRELHYSRTSIKRLIEYIHKQVLEVSTSIHTDINQIIRIRSDAPWSGYP